tara:strand:- start:111 stop:413 length:303 start_codon:yes stop_codon:yes gene_type:complete
MKTFKDLTFEPHSMGEGEHASLLFDNGRAVSVITGGRFFHTTDDKPYEVGFRTKDGKLGCVYLERGTESVTIAEDADHNDVQGYCTEDDVTLIMKAIQKL